LPHENKFLAARQTTTLAAYYLRMSSFLCKTAVAPTCLSVCLLAPALLRTAHAQVASTPESRIEHAKTLYYTPTNSGLNSFHCDVTVDWKDLLARFGVPNLHDSDPRLTYLNAIKLSLDDNLTGTGALNWFAPSGSASDPDDGIAKIRGGMQQMVSGFFQSWNPFLNGTYIPNFDATTTAKPEGDGIVVQSGDASALVVEHFNKSLLLTEMHVTTPAVDVLANPTFLETPHGRIISMLKSVVHQPPAGPAEMVTMASTYAPVASYQIPSVLTFTVDPLGAFVFKLSGCQVNTPPPTPKP
jgi:hypothetical protein